MDAIRNANKTFRPNYKVLHHYLSLDAQGLLIREVLENENRKYEFIPRIEENYEFDLLTKPYIVWGTGKTGRTIYQFLLEKGFKVIGFADGLIKDDNQIIFESVEIPVFSVRTLKKIESDFVIVIASNMKDEIFSTIKEEGIKKECIFYEQLYSFVAEEEIAAWKMMDWSYQEASDRYVNYRVLPKTKEESPVILYLHGAGSNGSDNRKQIAGMGELGQALVELRKELDFEVIVPQCPYSRYWMNGFNYSEGTFRCEDIKDVDLLNHIVDKLREKYVGNTLIIIGYSCGAYATWYLLMKYPKLFEKALIISGGADMSFDVGDVETKITLVHGKKDKIVPVCGSQNIYNVYKKYVDYYEYESLGHELTFDISNQEWKKIINNIVHG